MSLCFTVGAQQFTVALAVDRVVSILVPFWHRNLNKARAATRIGVTISVAQMFLPLPEIAFRVFDQDTKSCDYKGGRMPTFSAVFSMVTRFILPVGLMIFSNIVFVWALKNRQRKNRQREGRQGQESQKRSNETNFILMMLISTCSFLALLMFFLATIRMSIVYENAISDFFRSLGRVSLILNSSLNVVYYSSTKMFRNALIKAVKTG